MQKLHEETVLRIKEALHAEKETEVAEAINQAQEEAEAAHTTRLSALMEQHSAAFQSLMDKSEVRGIRSLNHDDIWSHFPLYVG